jgi:hypothetical protein
VQPLGVLPHQPPPQLEILPRNLRFSHWLILGNLGASRVRLAGYTAGENTMEPSVMS